MLKSRNNPKVSAFALILFLAVSIAAQTRSSADAALIGKLQTPDHRINSVAYSADGKLIAAGYGFFDDGGVTIWNTATREVVATINTSATAKAGISRVAFAPGGKDFAAASDKGQVFLWSDGNWKNHKVIIKGDEDKATDMVFSPDGSMLAVAFEGSAVLFDLATEKTSDIVSDKVSAVASRAKISPYGISFTPDGKSIIVSSAHSIMTWSVKEKKVVAEWNSRTFGFFGRLSNNGKLVIAGGGAVYAEKSVKIWSYPEGIRIGELTDFRHGLFALAISNSGKYFALGGGTYGSGGGTLSLWSVDGLREMAFASFGDTPVQGLAFGPDDKVLAASSSGGFVLLYDVEKLRGPEVRKQDYALCGEVAREQDEVFIVPLSKVPTPHGRDFQYSWKLKIANKESVVGLEGKPVALETWDIESFAADNSVRIHKLTRIGSQSVAPPVNDYVVFGDIQNPGWNTGSVVKIYSDGTYVATDNPSRCISYGSLTKFDTNFDAVSKRLVTQGLLNIPSSPLIAGMAHFRTRFITLFSNGKEQIKSDSGLPAKREAFEVIYTNEQPFIDMLVKSGRSDQKK